MLLRAAPWPALLGTAGGGALLGALALLLSTPTAVLQLSWLVLAAGCAWAVDEPAAAAVDACPVGRWRQLMARAAAAGVPLLLGLAVLGASDQRSWRLGLQLVGCCLLGFLTAVALRRRVDEPGELVSVVLLAVLVPPLVYSPWGDRLPLFRETDRGALLWGALLAAAAGVAVVRR